MNLTERVANLPRKDMSEVVCVHLYDDSDPEWFTHHNETNKIPIRLGEGWSATQIKEYILVKVLNAEEDDDYEVVDDHRYDGIQTIQLKDEKNNTSLLIVEWW